MPREVRSAATRALVQVSPVRGAAALFGQDRPRWCGRRSRAASRRTRATVSSSVVRVCPPVLVIGIAQLGGGTALPDDPQLRRSARRCRTVRTISAMTARMSCLRSTVVVLGASKTARTSAPARGDPGEFGVAERRPVGGPAGRPGRSPRGAPRRACPPAPSPGCGRPAGSPARRRRTAAARGRLRSGPVPRRARTRPAAAESGCRPRPAPARWRSSAAGSSTVNNSASTVFSNRPPPMLWQPCSPAYSCWARAHT